MSKTTRILIAGFGGQGALFAGKFLAYSGLIEDRMLSWLPSYGPEMRGGTANCGVIISDAPVGSPIVDTPDVLVAMNRPSFDKFEGSVAEGGCIVMDSTLIETQGSRKDIKVISVPATKMADDLGLSGLSNMILIGRMIRETGVVAMEDAEAALQKFVPARKAHLIESNLKALKAGYDFQ